MTPYTRTIVQPTAEPISTAEAKVHCRIDGTDEDAWLATAITAARQAAENFCNRYIAEQTVEARFSGWPMCQPWGMRLPGSDPARSVVVKYIDQDGAEQTADPVTYQIGWTAPSYVVNAWGVRWPYLRYEPDNVRITYVAGYTLPGASPQTYPLPAAIKQAMLLLIGNMYENREANVIGAAVAELPLGVQYLLQPFRLELGV